jgi:Flp pilus assembly protein TadG
MLITRPSKPARHGSAAVECAVVLILLMPLLLGTWEVGRLLQVQQLLQNAAREGGRQAATGRVNTAGVQQAVVNYLTNNGITCSTTNVTVTNLTSAARPDPSNCNQLDEFQVTVTIPFNSVRWVLLKQITPTTQLTASAYWYSMRDVPLTINTNIPLQ